MLFVGNHLSARVRFTSDSLQAKSYQYFLYKVDATADDSIAISYAEMWIKKAKSERHYEQLAIAYTEMMHRVPERLKLIFSDSTLSAATKSGNLALQGSALVSRGILYYKNRRYKEALDHYLSADALLIGSNDPYLKYKVSFLIAQLKYHLGYYEESRALFSKCTTYFMPNDTIPYLRSLHGLAMSLNHLHKYEEAAVENRKGLAMAYLSDDRTVVPYLTQSDGITAYGRQNYTEALSQLRMAMPAIRDANDYASEGISWLYLGKSFLALKKADSAALCFKNIDRIFTAHGYISPPLREAYELLIANYDKRGNEKMSLHYFRRLQAADKIFARDYRHLYDKISGEYNPSALKREIAENETKLARERMEKRLGYALLVTLLLLSIYVAIRYKKYMGASDPVSTTIVDVNENQTAAMIVNGLNQSLVDKVKLELERFEKNKGYRQSKLSLFELSKKVGSNPKYVASIIIHEKGYNHTCYLNNLRIQYVIEKLKNDPHFKKYTIKEIARDAGFATSNHFSNEFRARMGVLPSEYVKGVLNPHEMLPSSA